MKQKMKTKVVIYIVVPLILGLAITYTSIYYLHPLSPTDWYRYGFPFGWRNTEATGEGYGTPILTFYNPTGSVLDVLFWYGLSLLLLIVIARWSIRVPKSPLSDMADCLMS
jgi:hypothetical protein